MPKKPDERHRKLDEAPLLIAHDWQVRSVMQHRPLAVTETEGVLVNSERTSEPEQLAALCRTANPQADVRAFVKLAEAYEAAKVASADVIVIAGSLFLVGEALARLGFRAGRTPAAEKELVLQ